MTWISPPLVEIKPTRESESTEKWVNLVLEIWTPLKIFRKRLLTVDHLLRLEIEHPQILVLSGCEAKLPIRVDVKPNNLALVHLIIPQFGVFDRVGRVDLNRDHTPVLKSDDKVVHLRAPVDRVGLRFELSDP